MISIVEGENRKRLFLHFYNFMKYYNELLIIISQAVGNVDKFYISHYTSTNHVKSYCVICFNFLQPTVRQKFDWTICLIALNAGRPQRSVANSNWNGEEKPCCWFKSKIDLSCYRLRCRIVFCLQSCPEFQVHFDKRKSRLFIARTWLPSFCKQSVYKSEPKGVFR